MSAGSAISGRRRRRDGAIALGALVLALSGCHAIKVQLGMNAGASTSSSTPTSSTSSPSGDAASAQSASGGKKVHLGGGDKGQPGLLETLGRGLHDTHESSSFDASPYGVTPPKFKWNSRVAGSPDRGSRHHL